MAVFSQTPGGIWASGSSSVNGTTVEPSMTEVIWCTRGAVHCVLHIWTAVLTATLCCCSSLSNYAEWFRWLRPPSSIHQSPGVSSLHMLKQSTGNHVTPRVGDLGSHARSYMAQVWTQALSDLESRHGSRKSFCLRVTFVVVLGLCCTEIYFSSLPNHLPVWKLLIFAQTTLSFSPGSQQTFYWVSYMEASQMCALVLNVWWVRVKGISVK